MIKFIIAAIALLIILFVIAKICSQKTDKSAKGKYGETTVATILGDNIPDEQYVINNLLFCDKAGNSCQIDHVYINKNGIWVIETKNYSGRIYGNADRLEWTQVLAYGNNKNSFYNPIKQNKTHIHCLSEYLNVKDIFHNVVVFLSSADITNISDSCVYPIHKLRSIKTMQTDVTLSAEEMRDYYNKIIALKNGNQISEKQHVNSIHEKQARLQQGFCPRCGKKLVIREGKYGNFFGCSGYPKCKFTKDID